MAMVYFTITGGEVIKQLGIPITATILELKEMIETIFEVVIERQTLKFNDQVLMDDQTIGHFNFGPFATLVLDVTPLAGQPKLRIRVISLGKVIDVKVKETTLVFDLKKKLERRCGIFSKQITLHRLGKEMEDEFPLSAYYVCENSEVEMTIKIEPR